MLHLLIFLPYLLFFPSGPFLVLPLLVVATGWVCARRMSGVSRLSGLLIGGAVGVVVEVLFWFRLYAVWWMESALGIESPQILSMLLFQMLTLAIGIAGALAVVGICLALRARHMQTATA